MLLIGNQHTVLIIFDCKVMFVIKYNESFGERISLRFRIKVLPLCLYANTYKFYNVYLLFYG